MLALRASLRNQLTNDKAAMLNCSHAVAHQSSLCKSPGSAGEGYSRHYAFSYCFPNLFTLRLKKSPAYLATAG